jgi:glycosyltransferase involved in cell wall biosynthesis
MSLSVCQLCAVDFTVKHFLTGLMDGIGEQGWNVRVVCSDGEFVPELRERGYKVVTLPITRGMNPLAHAISIFRLALLFRRERFDILHVHTPVAALLGRIAGALAGIPMIIYTAHGFYFHENMRPVARRIFEWLEWIGGRVTDLLFTVSAEDAVTAVNLGFVPPGRVVAIGNGVKASRFVPGNDAARRRIRSELGIPVDAIAIGMVGRMVAEKGFPEFLAAARSIAQTHPDVYFVGVGDRLASDHAAGFDAELALARTALGARLVLTGLRSDIPDLLAALDVFTLPSHREGMPITIIEAMMMALPVVATDIRGSREEVVPGQTGVLVPVKDEAALAAALRGLIDDPLARKRMGGAGRARALLLYDEAAVIAKQIAEIRARLPAGLRARA